VGSADARVSIFKTEKDIRKVAEASIERHIDEISCVAVHVKLILLIQIASIKFLYIRIHDLLLLEQMDLS
jgi:hypothetical protein